MPVTATAPDSDPDPTAVAPPGHAATPLPGGPTLLIALALGLLAAGTGRREPHLTADPGPPPVLRLDPSTAPAGWLAALPRLGPALSRRIVAAREQGPFRSPDDLDRRVSGIGPRTVAALRPYLLFPTPTRPGRTADAGMSPP